MQHSLSSDHWKPGASPCDHFIAEQVQTRASFLVDMEAGGGEVFDMDVMGCLKDNPDACPVDEDDVEDEGEVHVGVGSWRCCPWRFNHS